MYQGEEMVYPVKCQRCREFNWISLGSGGSIRDYTVMYSVVGTCKNCNNPLYVERLAFDHIDGELHLHMSDLTREDLEQLRILLSKPENRNLDASEVEELLGKEFGKDAHIVRIIVEWLKQNKDSLELVLILSLPGQKRDKPVYDIV